MPETPPRLQHMLLRPQKYDIIGIQAWERAHNSRYTNIGMYALESASNRNSDEELSYTGHSAMTTLPASDEKLQQI